MKKFVSMLLPLCLSLLLFSAVAFAAEAPSLPGGTLTADVVSFASKQTYAVYAAPDSKGIRGANGRARVSTNDWIQVFGTDGDWLLVQYAITDSHFRIGYIDKKALPEDAQISELCLTAIPAVVNYDVVVTGDTKGHGKQNVVDSLKIAMATTLLGTEGIFARCDIAAKTDRNGDEKFTLNTFSRATWSSPDPLVILYSLYKFAEACEGYYQFTLTTLMDASIERGGISPTEIFGLSGETMEKLLNGLSINHPEFITCSFKMDLDSITLRSDKTSDDVLALFEA